MICQDLSMWCNRMRGMTYSYVWHDPFMCVTWALFALMLPAAFASARHTLTHSHTHTRTHAHTHTRTHLVLQHVDFVVEPLRFLSMSLLNYLLYIHIYVYTYVNICIYMYVYIYTYILNMYIFICTYIHVEWRNRHISMYTYVYIYTCICATYIRTYEHTNWHTQTHMYMLLYSTSSTCAMTACNCALSDCNCALPACNCALIGGTNGKMSKYLFPVYNSVPKTVCYAICHCATNCPWYT